MLNSTFIDSLESDIELLQRLNQFSHLMPEARRPVLGRGAGGGAGDFAEPADR